MTELRPVPRKRTGLAKRFNEGVVVEPNGPSFVLKELSDTLT